MATSNDELKEMLTKQGLQLALMEKEDIDRGKRIERIERIVVGYNGIPGMDEQVRLIDERTKKQERQSDEIMLILKGDEKSPGLVERVRSLEEMKKTVRYWTGFGLGAVIIWIITGILEILGK